MELYNGERHRQFLFPGDGQTGALLLHGFMGSPGELRPLGEALAAAGVTAHGPLLPGFGADVAALGGMRVADWVDAARRAWAEVSAAYARSVLIGFSLGGALALHVAAGAGPSHLVLLAPFWKLPDWRVRLLPIVKHLQRDFLPFANADFADPATRDEFRSIDPTLDLDDPETQARLRRELTIPTAAVDELRKAGAAAPRLAARVQSHTLIVQGLNDKTVRAERTRSLAARFLHPPRLLELAVDHQLVRPNRPVWPEVRDAVVGFVTAPAAAGAG